MAPPAQSLSPLSPVSRGLWVLLILGIALAAIPVQMDRQARKSYWIVDWVPQAFSSFAAEARLDDDVETGDPNRVREEARKLLARRPVPASHLSLFAMAEGRAGNEAVAAQAIYVAAQREWRDALSQQAIAEVALANGEPEVAAKRLYALWAITDGNQDDDSRLSQLTQAVLADPVAQKHFGRQLVGAVRWNRNFFDWAARGLPDESFASTIASAQRAGVRFECVPLGKRTRELMGAGKQALAALAWSGPCAAGQSRGARDFAFYPIEAPAGSGPFDWAYPESGVVDLQFVQDVGETGNSPGALQFGNSDPVTRQIAERFVQLAPGRHVAGLRAKMRGTLMTGGVSDPRIQMHVDCPGGDDESMDLTRVEAGDEPQDFVVPAGCTVVRLALFVQRGQGLIETAWVR